MAVLTSIWYFLTLTIIMSNCLNYTILGVFNFDCLHSDTRNASSESEINHFIEFIKRRLATLDNISINYEEIELCENNSYTNSSIWRNLDDIMKKTTIIGVIADLRIYETSLLENMTSYMNTEKIPVFVYGYKEKEIENLKDSPYIFSTNQEWDDVTAIVQLTLKLKWTYVQVIYQETFKNISKTYKNQLDHQNVCVLKEYVVNENTTDLEYRLLLDQVAFETTTKGVIVFMDEIRLRKLFQARDKTRKGDMYFISLTSVTSDNVTQDIENSMLGTITLKRQYEEMKYIELYRNQPGKTDINIGEIQSVTRFVLHSITTLLLSLDATIQSRDSGGNQSVSKTDGDYIKKEILHNIKKNRNTEVLNLQINNGNYSWIKIAEFDGANITTYVEPTFYDYSGLMITSVPKSYSEPFRYECRPNYFYPVVSDSADLYIVAVLPVHDTGYTPDGCGRLNSDYAIISESILFGTNKINFEQTILSNLTLGFVILDSCGLKDRVLVQLEKLFAGNLNQNLDKKIQQKIIGTVGFPEDKIYMEIAPYLATKQLVTISSHATSAVLSNKNVYPYFVRLSPSETTEVEVIISVLENLKIKQIGLMYSHSIYGVSKAKLMFNSLDRMQDLSINYHIRVDDEYTQNDDVIDYLVSTFLAKNLPTVKTIVTFLETRHLETILTRMKLSNNSDILLISNINYFSEIGHKAKSKFEDIFKNAIFIEPSLEPCQELRNHLKSISENKESTNRYFIEYLKHNGSDVNTRDQHLKNNLYGYSLMIDSVSALAIGVDKLIASYCNSQEFCYEAQKNLDKLPEHIQIQTFTGICGNKVQFDSKYDVIHRYDVLQLRDHSINQIGVWENGLLQIRSHVRISENLPSPCKDHSCFKPPNDLLEMKYIYEYGEAMIYGFLEIHSNSPSGECSQNINEIGFQIMNSILWSVKEINKAGDLLPNTTLGVALFDTCGSAERTEGLVRSVLRPSLILSQKNFMPSENVILGVIGGDTDVTAIGLEKGTRMMDRNIPIIITSHTSVLNDRVKHPRLYRTVLPDTVEIDFLLQLLVQFNWTFVHVIFDSSTHDNIEYLEQNGRDIGVCLATKSISENPDDAVFLNSAFDNMTKVAEASVLVVLAETKTIRNALIIARDKGLSGKLHWVVPNEEGNTEDVYRGLEDVALGLITVKINVKINKSFQKDFSGLHLKNNKSLPWLPEFWEKIHRCNLGLSNKYDKSCTSDLTMNSTYQDFRTEASINAAYSLAAALDIVMKRCNDNFKDCLKRNQTDFYLQIKNALDNVKAFPKGGKPFSFHNRNATASFSILNLQRSPNGNVRFLEVGSYSNGNMKLDFRKLILHTARQQYIPLSKCPGHCLQCIDAKFLSSYSETVKMLYMEGPQMNHNFGSAIGLITILLNFTCAVLLVVIIYYLYQNTRHKAISLVVDANIFLLLSSVIVALSSIVFLFNTSEVTCFIQRSIPGCVLTVPIGCLLIKLNKAVCLRNVVGRNQILVPKWDFCLTFLPVMMTSPIIVYFALAVNNQTSVSWSVQDVQDVTQIKEIKISWTCKINRDQFLIFFTITWQLLLEAIIITAYYRIRHSTQPEIKEVIRSLVVITTVILSWSFVLLITENYNTFSVLVCLTLPFVGILLIIINFLPFILVLINEEKQTMEFSTAVLKGKSKTFLKRWRGKGTDANEAEQQKPSITDLKIPTNSSQSVSAKRAFTRWKGKDEKPRNGADTDIQLSTRT